MAGPLVSYLMATVLVCGFSVASAILAPLVLTVLPQGVEVLRTMADEALLNPSAQSDDFARVVLFLLSLLWWAAANWYGARLLLQRRGISATLDYTPARLDRTALAWRAWLPRALIPLGVVPIAIGLFGVGQFVVGLAALCVGAGLFALVVFRRRMLRRFGRAWGRPSAVAAFEAGGRRSDLPAGEVLALTLAAAFVLVLIIGLAWVNYTFARWMGAAAILLLAVAGITLFFNVLLVYLPRTRGWPSLAAAVVLFAVLLSNLGMTENHGVASRRFDPELQTRIVRPKAEDYWDAWVQDRKLSVDDNSPIILVAAEGGASRSAWWTGHVLGALDDVTGGRFGSHVFAVSGISGGSLGTATWVALHRRFYRDFQPHFTDPALVRSLKDPPMQKDCETAGSLNSLAASSACFLGGDFVSTTLGYMLGADLLQRILPAAVESWDRSRGLESTWVRDWKALASQRAEYVRQKASELADAKRAEADKAADGTGGGPQAGDAARAGAGAAAAAAAAAASAVEQLVREPTCRDGTAVPRHAAQFGTTPSVIDPGFFGCPLMALYDRPGQGTGWPRTDLPLLVLNTATAQCGRPLLQAPVRVEDPEVGDLFDPVLRTAGLTLAGAVHNSARFPYVSPGGNVKTAAGDHYDTLVDGGYIENSGAQGLAALMRAVARKDPAGWKARWRDRLIVVFIANDPLEQVSAGPELCSNDIKPLDAHGGRPLGELTTPPVGLFASRSGRADASRRALLRELGLCEPRQSARVATSPAAAAAPKAARVATAPACVQAAGPDVCVVLPPYPRTRPIRWLTPDFVAA